MQKNKRLIAKIFNGDKVVMTIDRNMLSCEFGALDRGNLTDVVNWGIYANRGSISFIDNIGYFNNQNVNSTDIKKYIVKFYLAKNQETLIATFKVDNVDFDDETRRVDIQLIGKVIELQRKPSVHLDFGNKELFPFSTTSAKYLLGLSEDATDPSYSGYYPSYDLILGEDSKRIESTFIYCPYLPFGNVWDKFRKICQATMSRVIEDENGDPIITGERPSRTPIIVRPKNIISISKSDFVKVKNPSIDLTNRTRYENKKVEQISKQIFLNYDEDGEPLSISGVGGYDFGETESDVSGSYSYREANINYKSNIPYKTKSVSYSLKTENWDIEVEGKKTGSYSTESAPEQEVIGGEYDTLFLSDSFNFFVSYTGQDRRLLSVDYSFNLDYFEDGTNKTKSKITDVDEEDTLKIDSNDFIQTLSYYKSDDGKESYLGDYILDEVSRRYSNGIECFEIECLFNDYYDVNGNKVFDTNDLSNHFEKYDVIIPYVMKKGKTVPLRVNEDEKPKLFRIIGISYSYDGLLKQKLSVQEERYDVD